MENKQIGPYLVAERLGRNRRQRVFRAIQTERQLEVALKFIGIPGSADRNKAIEKIQIEVDLLKQLDHPNLVKILGAGVSGEDVYFAYELVEGESLSAAISRRGRFAPDQVVDFGRQIARLLDYLHEQDIIHSKLTPDKILIGANNRIKVADLRLNRSRKKRWDSARKRELDIAAYMAPEQLTEGATAKSDIYSLGVVLYEMLTGKLPYEPDTMGRMTRKKMQTDAPSVSSQVMNCPVWLDKIVCQMIAPDPKRRPHSAKVVVLAMKELKAMDKSKQAAISKVKKGFTPLTVGADRSEANRLLNPKQRWQFDPAIFQSTGFMIFGLLIIVAIVTWSVWPESTQSRFDKAETLMASDDPSDWRAARTYLKTIMEDRQDPLSTAAEELYFDSRRQTLIVQAKRGRIMGLQSEDTQLFIQAYQLQNEGKFTPAIEIYQKLVKTVEPDGVERFIFDEAEIRLQQCLDAVGNQGENPVDADVRPEQDSTSQEKAGDQVETQFGG